MYNNTYVCKQNGMKSGGGGKDVKSTSDSVTNDQSLKDSSHQAPHNIIHIGLTVNLLCPCHVHLHLR